MKHSVIKNILRLLFGVLHLQACSLQSLVSGDGGDDAMEVQFVYQNRHGCCVVTLSAHI